MVVGCLLANREQQSTKESLPKNQEQKNPYPRTKESLPNKQQPSTINQQQSTISNQQILIFPFAQFPSA